MVVRRQGLPLEAALVDANEENVLVCRRLPPEIVE
jgi:hypothetical protein